MPNKFQLFIQQQQQIDETIDNGSLLQASQMEFLRRIPSFIHSVIPYSV